MRRGLHIAVALGLLAPLFVGASCNDDADGNGGGTEVGADVDEHEGERIETLPGVDVSDLTRGERRVYLDIVNDVLSPCGQPISVARCVSESRDCRSCVPAARYLVRLVTEGYERAEIEDMFQARFGRDQVLEIPLGDAPVRGARMAPITIVEFSDFECPYCGAAHPEIRRALREHEGQVRLIFRHYPLEGHLHATPAARAAIAAGNQGKFWEMHDLLFENQEALEPEDLEGYAERLGLDVERFRTDVASEATQRRVEADKALGRELDVTGTPAIFINGRRFKEAPRSLGAYLREELDAQ